jgi:Skp family chaperone for outer membrane proteins
MFKKIIQTITVLIIGLSLFSNAYASDAYFIDFKKVLNESKAGADAQKILKKKLETASNKFKKQEGELIKQEQEIISKKKMITNDEFKKKVENLRKKVAELQKKKQDTFSGISKSRNDAKQQLLKAVNPIIKKYMEDNKIKLVLDKAAILLGDKNLEITSQIIEELNKELKSLKIN